MKKNRKLSAKKAVKKIMALCGLICLLGSTALEPAINVYATETSQENEEKETKTAQETEASQENTTERVREIGKETPASNYIKAKDWPAGPSVSAYSAVLMDVETGTVLYAKNPDTQLYPASITKIMTALLILENHELDEKVVFEGDALAALPLNYTFIPAVQGEEISVKDCLGGLLVYSANNMANALAQFGGGGIKNFAEMMNERAAQAGAKNTHFTNPSGLHEEDHYTTAYDMCQIMRACVQLDSFNELAGTKVYTMAPTNKRSEEYTIYAKHDMLYQTKSAYYQYCVSGKTGYTDEARNTLVTYAEKDGMKLVCCVMKCGKGEQYKSTRALFDYGFSNFKKIDVSEISEHFTLENAGIFAGEEAKAFSNFSIETVSESPVILPASADLSKVETSITYLDEQSDGCFAQITYNYQGMAVGTARLKMTNMVQTVSEFQFEEETQAEPGTQVQSTEVQNDIWGQYKNIDVRIIIGVIAGITGIAIAAVILYKRENSSKINFKKKRKRRR